MTEIGSGLSLKQLKYFVATAESGQISRAATALSISQSAITTAIQELEKTLGAELFRRSSHGVELTEHGRNFLAHAYDILAKVEEAMRLPATRGEALGTLTIATTYTVIGYFLPFHLQRLRRLYPNLTFSVQEVNRQAIEAGLVAGRYDIAVLLSSNVTTPTLSVETLLSSVRRLWVPWQHVMTTERNVALARVAREPYIMLTVDEAADTALKYWAKTPHRPAEIMRTSSVEAVRSMVANGEGVAILSDMVYRPWSLEGKRIDTINLADPIPSMDVGLAWKKDADFTPAMTAFRSYFRQTFQIPNSRNYL